MVPALAGQRALHELHNPVHAVDLRSADAASEIIVIVRARVTTIFVAVIAATLWCERLTLAVPVRVANTRSALISVFIASRTPLAGDALLAVGGDQKVFVTIAGGREVIARAGAVTITNISSAVCRS